MTETAADQLEQLVEKSRLTGEPIGVDDEWEDLEGQSFAIGGGSADPGELMAAPAYAPTVCHVCQRRLAAGEKGLRTWVPEAQRGIWTCENCL